MPIFPGGLSGSIFWEPFFKVEVDTFTKDYDLLCGIFSQIEALEKLSDAQAKLHDGTFGRCLGFGHDCIINIFLKRVVRYCRDQILPINVFFLG